MQQTKHIYIRLITQSDVDLLLDLRLNQNLNKYLNQVDDDKEQQLNWLKIYKQREVNGTDFYFVIVDKKLGEIGLVRVYDIDYANKSFTWGSWIIKEENRPKYAAIESALLVYEFAFNELNLSLAKFVVDNNNLGVIKFHNRFGAKYLFTDEVNNNFELSKTLYIQLKYNQYYKFLLN